MDDDDTLYCPHCGGEVPEYATACPHCGSDEETGWSDDADEAAALESEDDFDYDEYLAREFPENAPKSDVVDLRHAARWLLVLILVLMMLGWLWL